MKKNLWANIHKFLNIGLLAYILLLCLLSGITGVAVTHAVSSGCIVFCTPTVTSTPTPTSTPAPTPTPTQSPRPTPTPQSQSTTVVPPVTTMTTATLASVTPTSAPANVTATVIAATVTPDQTTTIGADTSSANQQSQDAEDTNFNTPMLFVGIGTPILLLAGGGFFWLLWRRRLNQRRLGSSNNQTSRWISSREIQSNLDTIEHAALTVFTPEMTDVSGGSGGPGVLPMLGSTQPMPSSQQIYPPGHSCPPFTR